jgi:tetratricopeptide (TPR) repeat protein
MKKILLAAILFCSLSSIAQTKDFVDLGNERYKNKDYEGAILDYYKELEKNPKSTAAYYNIGISNNALNKYPEAVNAFNKAVEIDATYVLGYIGRSKSWNYLKNYDAALNDINKAIELDPKNKDAYSHRITLKRQKGDYDALIADYGKIAEIDPTDKSAYNSRGFYKRLKRDYYGALGDYTTAISLDPKYISAYTNRASTWVDLKENQKAIDDNTKVIEMDPTKASGYTSRASTKRRIKDYEGSLADFDKAIELDPKYFFAYTGKAVTKREMKDYDGAIVEYDRAIALNTNNVSGLTGKSIVQTRAKYFEGALESINKAMLEDAKNNRLYYNRANVYYAMAKFEEEVSDLKKGLAADPDFGANYTGLAEALARLHRFSEAADNYKKFVKDGHLYTLQTDPSWIFFIKYLEGISSVAQNDNNTALALLKESERLYNDQEDKEDENKNGTLVSVYSLMGYVLEQLGREDEAMDIYKKALLINNGQTDIKESLAALEKKVSDIAKTDKIPPVIDIISPKPTRSFDIESDNGKTEIIGKAKDNSGIAWVKINGTAIQKVEEDGLFVVELPLKAGANEITITAKDKQGNEASKTFTLNGTAVAKGNKNNEPALALMTESPQNYYAVLIANNDYADPSIPDLKNPMRDARELKKILLNLYTFKPGNIDTLYNKSREEILQAIMLRCGKLSENDNLLIFYAGHGTAEKDKFGDVDGYWIPVSAKKGFPGSYISANDINTSLRRSNAKHILLIADACFSGAFTRALPAEAGVNIQKQYSVPSRKIMASGNLEPVPDNSKFIFYLRKSLQENKEKYISAKDLFDSFYKSILSNTDNLPQYAAIKNVGDEGGEFVFIKK